MDLNAINLAFRFLLEIAALISFGFLGWSLAKGAPKYLLALGLPILAAAIWGLFAVPDDPSRSGNAPIPVPGIVRLLLEFLFFATAVWAFAYLRYSVPAIVVGISVLVHYAVSYDRIVWLLRQ